MHLMFSPLSDREVEVAMLAAKGCTDKEIAVLLGVSVATVRTYWDRIKVKVQAKTRTHAVVIVFMHRLGNQHENVAVIPNSKGSASNH